MSKINARDIKNIAIQDDIRRKLAAKAKTGHMGELAGKHMIVAVDPTIQPGIKLKLKSLYWVGAPGVPAMYMQLDHADQGKYVFLQVPSVGEEFPAKSKRS